LLLIRPSQLRKGPGAVCGDQECPNSLWACYDEILRLSAGTSNNTEATDIGFFKVDDEGGAVAGRSHSHFRGKGPGHRAGGGSAVSLAHMSHAVQPGGAVIALGPNPGGDPVDKEFMSYRS
jgi:hypothetical protein